MSRLKSQLTKTDELAALVHPRDGHPKILAMIEAYLDESGIHDGAAMCVIAGYYGGPGQLRKLEVAWKKVLADFHFPMDKFHAKDLLKLFKHRPMLEALAGTIAEHKKVHPVSVAIVVPDFNSFTLNQRRWLTGAVPHPNTGKFLTSGCPSKAYFVPFGICLQLVTDYAPVGGKAHFFFGLDRPFAEYATDLFKQVKKQVREGSYPDSKWVAKDRLGDPSFPNASETAQLQAADLFVHLTYQHSVARHAAHDWNVAPTGMLADCLRNTRSNTDHVFQDKSCLELLFQYAQRAARPRVY